ncbi:phosphatidylinositol kinase-related protein kinase [Martiniozyma asiatica (nom. inval.)]|nr:phosphatidylinositol kinase-related protein kinase [Martiniozyma asiatica]
MSQQSTLGVSALSTGQSSIIKNYTVDQIFQELRSKDEICRIKAAKDLRRHVVSISRNMSTFEQLSVYNNYINKKIFDLIISTNVNCQLGGVCAINSLLELLNSSTDDSHPLTQLTTNSASSSSDENSNTITRYANYLRRLLPSNDETVMRAACETIGILASFGGSISGDHVEIEIKRSLEWLLNEKSDVKKHAAILIISSLANNAPTMLYQYIKDILNNIWMGLRDYKLIIREDSAICLRNCLNIVYERDSELRAHWFTKLYNEATTVFKVYGVNNTVQRNTQNNSPLLNSPLEYVHGSLLCYRELVIQGTSILATRIDEIYETILNLKDHKAVDVRSEVTKIIPKMARYDKIKFVDKYMHRVLLYYISQLKVGKDIPIILISIGDIAVETKNNIINYLNGILLESIKEGLNPKNSKTKKDLTQACFYCLIRLATSLGPPLTKFINNYQILKLVLACPINDNMLSVLKVFIQYLPSSEHLINDKLLKTISYCLSGYQFKHPGAPDFEELFDDDAAYNYRRQMLQKEGTALNKATIKELADVAQISTSRYFEDPDVGVILQSLKALQVFDFKNYNLNEFVRYVLVNYTTHENPQVRLQSSLACSNIYARSSVCFERSGHSLKNVDIVLGKLLTISITDAVSEIRFEVLNSLKQSFDPHLSQAENVKLLFIALNDENFEVRKAAVQLVGRLTFFNPAYIVPPLRKMLIQIITKMEYGGRTTRIKEETNVILGLLISCTGELTRPYTIQIMDALIPHATDASPSVAAAALVSIGEMSTVAGKDMLVFIPKLMPILLEFFQDQNSGYKRDAALKCLGKLAGSSGYVIQPLLDYPQLLGILVNVLKSDSSSSTRRETVKLLGILGALDPYKHREVERRGQDAETVAEQNAPSIDMELLMKGKSPTNEDYFPTVVIKTLLKILKDPSFSTHHLLVAKSLMQIFKNLGLRCVPFLDQVIPGFISVMHSCPHSMINTYFQLFGDMIAIVKLNIRPFLAEIFKVIKEFFVHVKFQASIILVIEQIAKALEDEFKIYVLELITLFLDVLENDTSPGSISSMRILKAFIIFGNNMEPYIFIIVPSLVRLFEYSNIAVRNDSIECIGRLARNISMNDYASEIIQPLLRLLSNTDDNNLQTTAVTTICSLLLQMGSEFSVFVPVVTSVLINNKLQFPIYDKFVERLSKGEPLPSNGILYQDLEETNPDITDINGGSKKLPVNPQTLKNVWDCSTKRTREDWQEWMRKLSIELLKESPSPSLRACSALAVVYPPLAKDLFNCAFASCWNELHLQYQGELAQALCIALSSPNSSPEIHQALLNLTEYLEHDEKSLPIRIQTLGQYAQKSHAYAKTLHYKELEFIQEPTIPTIESLISINNQLQQSDAAIGILQYAQEHHGLQLKETWYEKLQRWDDALKAYNEREKDEPDSTEITMGKMRCLHALGEWESLSQLAQNKWKTSSSDIRRAIAPLAAAASWGLGQWEKMGTYINVMKKDSPDKAFFNAVLSLHNNNFNEASTQITKARDLLVTEVTALVSESYNRAYSVVVRVQMLAELEEIIQYKRLPMGSEKRVHIVDTWNKRLIGCQKNVDIWQRMLKARSLVVKPKQDMAIWIKFANLCRKSGRLGLAEKSLNALLDDDHTGGKSQKGSAHVVYAQLKYMWARGQKDDALTHLVDFTSKLSRDLGVNENEAITQPLPKNIPGVSDDVEKFTRLLARCYLKQGEWKIASSPNWAENEAESILGSFLLATHFDSNWYKAWHNWALANYEVIPPQSKNYAGEQPERKDREANEHMVSTYVVPAVKGFFHSIALSNSNPVQDTLRLLTLWINFGNVPEVTEAMQEGFQMVKIDTWVDVIPQLISHIHQPDPLVSHSLLGLLSDLGRAHPQALVYPLTVAIKSESKSRQKAALTIIDKMRAHSSILVDQAELVSKELIRVAVLWHEMWYEALEDASRAYFGEDDIEKMFSILEPLHELLQKGPETIREISFANTFGKELTDAHGWLLEFRKKNDRVYINQAWDLYYTVFRRISKQLPLLQNLDLQHVSPKLLNARDLKLAVPGTSEAGKEIVHIVKFEPIFVVITSKQRPRKLNCWGSNGKKYQFALKGHEDIRQDNLVMQLFGLVNTLLANDPECFKRHLDIQCYAAIPLSPSSGLLSWVPNSDTFHVLIKEYREPRKIYLDVEHRVMLQMSPDYDNLMLLQKVEVFTYALDITRGQDLYKVLWLKSKSSEAWLDRRTTYTRSLAVMSMVGYILGLGDRHPSNLMMDRVTGRVVHIDFGDCFEAAILREKYPEKVPFRLTRMLSYAMEVSGIEGSFRITSDNVMRVLRDNTESLMAILEAFAYDPLINWGFDFPLDKIADKLGYDLPEQNFHEKFRNGEITSDEMVQMEATYKNAIRNARAMFVLQRINEKLTGNDFKRFNNLDVSTQVDKLIQQATSVENLCQHYIGWCSFW